MSKQSPMTYDRENRCVVAPTNWTDEQGVKHFDLRYPRIITQVSDDWDQARHGLLFAAASDLLTAAKAHLLAREALENASVHNLDLDDPRFAAINITLEDLRAAIAKAEGGAA